MPAKVQRTRVPSRQVLARLIALWCWAYLLWVLLTWTLTAEQLLFGAVVALAVAVALAPLGEVVRPWPQQPPRARHLAQRRERQGDGDRHDRPEEQLLHGEGPGQQHPHQVRPAP